MPSIEVLVEVGLAVAAIAAFAGVYLPVVTNHDIVIAGVTLLHVRDPE